MAFAVHVSRPAHRGGQMGLLSRAQGKGGPELVPPQVMEYGRGGGHQIILSCAQPRLSGPAFKVWEYTLSKPVWFVS